MTGVIITAGLSLLALIGSAIAWLVQRRDKAKNPLPRHAAEVALSREALGIVGESRDVLKEDLDRLRADRERDRARLDQQGADIERVSGEVDDLRANEGRLVAWVVTLHAGVQNGTIPPLPDVPDWLDILLHRTTTSDD